MQNIIHTVTWMIWMKEKQSIEPTKLLVPLKCTDLQDQWCSTGPHTLQYVRNQSQAPRGEMYCQAQMHIILLFPTLLFLKWCKLFLHTEQLVRNFTNGKIRLETPSQIQMPYVLWTPPSHTHTYTHKMELLTFSSLHQDTTNAAGQERCTR